MNSEQLESFLAICKYESISQASHHLFITQPSLTNRINKLEDFLNVKLFERSWEGVQLTKEGDLFLPHALKMLNKLQSFNNLSNQIKDIYSDVLFFPFREKEACFKIGINNYLIPKYSNLIFRFFENFYPTLNIEIVTGSSQSLLQKLDYGLLNHIIYYDTDVNRINTTVLKDESMVIVLRKDDAKSINDNYKLIGNLQKTLYLNSDPTHSKHFPLFKLFYDSVNIKNVIVLENLHLIKDSIINGKGFAIVPYSVYEYEFKPFALKYTTFPSNISYLPILSSHKTNDHRVKKTSNDLDNALLQLKCETF